MLQCCPLLFSTLRLSKTRVRSLSVIFLGLKNVSVFSKVEQVVITRELKNNMAGKPSDRASPWTMEGHSGTSSCEIFISHTLKHLRDIFPVPFARLIILIHSVCQANVDLFDGSNCQ